MRLRYAIRHDDILFAISFMMIIFSPPMPRARFHFDDDCRYAAAYA